MQNEELVAVDRVIEQFFQVFDNRNDQTPDFSVMKQLLLPSVVIHRVEKAHIESMNLVDFLEPRMKLLASGSLSGFHEWETDSQTTINGHLASRVSHYAKSGCLDGQLYQGSGVKHFQLIKKPGSWHIASIIWQDE